MNKQRTDVYHAHDSHTLILHDAHLVINTILVSDCMTFEGGLSHRLLSQCHVQACALSAHEMKIAYIAQNLEGPMRPGKPPYAAW